MGLSDIAGVLSRKFVVGFFIPVFFATLVLTRLVDARALPTVFKDSGLGVQGLIVGGIALLVGLLLSGFHYPLLRLLEGYWLISAPIDTPDRSSRHKGVRLLQRTWGSAAQAAHHLRLSVGESMVTRWRTRREYLVRIRESEPVSPRRTAAARALNNRFPALEQHLLPTEFGNTIRAFETHPRLRYNLDGIALWPRIATLLSEGERRDLEEATTDLAFWVNGLVLVAVAGAVVFAERLWDRPATFQSAVALEMLVLGGAAILASFMYRQAISAATRWGDHVRAAFDVHRLQLYDVLGVLKPTLRCGDTEVGEAVNRLLAFAEPIPDHLRAVRGANDSPPADQPMTAV